VSCLIWTGAHSRDGYGHIRRDGKTRILTRVVWEDAYGPIPHGMCVCHTCDVPPCYKLSHLFLGTRSDNMRDMVAKGRNVPGPGAPNFGSKNGRAILTVADILVIRYMYATGRHSQQSIADAFGVGQSQVSRIVRQVHWQ